MKLNFLHIIDVLQCGLSSALMDFYIIMYGNENYKIPTVLIIFNVTRRFLFVLCIRCVVLAARIDNIKQLVT